MTKIPFQSVVFNPRAPLSRKTFLRGAAATIGGAAAAIVGTALPVIGGEQSALATGGNKKTGVAGLNMVEIAPGVFVHKGAHGVYTPANGGDISNLGFVVGNDAVAVIDTGGTFLIGKALKEAITAVTDKPIRYVINTHMHPDHVFGNAAFKSVEPEFVAHHKMARGLAARSERYLAINKENAGEDAFKGTEVVLPNRPVKAKETIDLGGRELVLEPQPTAHTDNDLVITDTKTQTLFLGDLLFSEHCPALDGSILGWLSVIDRLSKKPGARVVPGHGPVTMAWPDALKAERRYLQAITDDVRGFIAQGSTMSEAMETAAGQEKVNWELFDDFHKRNVSAAFAELEWE